MSSVGNEEAQWQDVFNIYDGDKDGKISKAEFISAVRVLGRRYTKDQMEEKMKAFGDQVHWDHFYGFMCDPYSGPTDIDLENALKAFDGKDEGTLTTSQLQSLLTGMGDKMSTADATAVLAKLPNEHGVATLAEIVEYLTPSVPSTTPNIPELLKEVMREEVKKSGMAEELRHMPAAPVVAAAAATTPRADAEEGGDAAAEDGDEVDTYNATHSTVVDDADL